ncbi:hypothetical protein HK098_006963 [Nowakowskiella sp. JEL0407]|nr:hypothetical protein HK098_006963 [Nowakowskiella sp. JEL0407]
MSLLCCGVADLKPLRKKRFSVASSNVELEKQLNLPSLPDKVYQSNKLHDVVETDKNIHSLLNESSTVSNSQPPAEAPPRIPLETTNNLNTSKTFKFPVLNLSNTVYSWFAVDDKTQISVPSAPPPHQNFNPNRDLPPLPSLHTPASQTDISSLTTLDSSSQYFSNRFRSFSNANVPLPDTVIPLQPQPAHSSARRNTVTRTQINNSLAKRYSTAVDDDCDRLLDTMAPTGTSSLPIKNRERGDSFRSVESVVHHSENGTGNDENDDTDTDRDSLDSDSTTVSDHDNVSGRSRSLSENSIHKDREIHVIPSICVTTSQSKDSCKTVSSEGDSLSDFLSSKDNIPLSGSSLVRNRSISAPEAPETLKRITKPRKTDEKQVKFSPSIVPPLRDSTGKITGVSGTLPGIVRPGTSRPGIYNNRPSFSRTVVDYNPKIGKRLHSWDASINKRGDKFSVLDSLPSSPTSLKSTQIPTLQSEAMELSANNDRGRDARRLSTTLTAEYERNSDFKFGMKGTMSTADLETVMAKISMGTDGLPPKHRRLRGLSGLGEMKPPPPQSMLQQRGHMRSESAALEMRSLGSSNYSVSELSETTTTTPSNSVNQPSFNASNQQPSLHKNSQSVNLKSGHFVRGHRRQYSLDVSAIR